MKLIVDIKKRLADFDLDISFQCDSDTLGILGASGSGKSMTLRCIAGIETPDSGQIILGNQTLFDSRKGINLRPQKRRTGYLFQHYALFPTMTVRENLAIVLSRWDRPRKEARIRSILEDFHLEGLALRRPGQLSGGQQQRVALARLMVSEPKIIMLDEPLSALDSYLRSQIEGQLLRQLADFTGPVLLVSHNRDEIYRMCRRVVVVDHGRVAGEGLREAVFGQPQSLAAARLTGCKNLAPAFRLSDTRVGVPAWGLELDCPDLPDRDFDWIGIRSHHLRPGRPGEGNCADFYLVRDEHEPFSLVQYLRPVNAQDPKILLRREFPRDTDFDTPLDTPLSHQPGSGTRLESRSLRLCLPPERLLFLKSGPDRRNKEE